MNYFKLPLFTIICLFSACNVKGQAVIGPDAVVEKVTSGFQFVEGPLWLEGKGLIFSDIQGNTVYQYIPGETESSVFLSPSGRSNGLALDPDGNLLLAQHEKRAVSRIVGEEETSIVETYEGKKLNSPNDLAVKSDGAIFFTDPPYGISGGQQELEFSGIYRISPTGDLTLLDNTLSRPNGIAFSPDESKLYVNDSETRNIFTFDVEDDGTITNKQLLYSIELPGNTDGMKVDPNGFLYCTGPLGVWVFSPEGEVVDTILVPEKATNCAFGDDDMKTLYVTSGTSVYKVRSAAVTSNKYGTESLGTPLRLPFPNPAVSSVTIPVDIKAAGAAKLHVTNTEGKTIKILADKILPAGYQEFLWETEGLIPGIYTITLAIGGKSFIQQCVVQK